MPRYAVTRTTGTTDMNKPLGNRPNSPALKPASRYRAARNGRRMLVGTGLPLLGLFLGALAYGAETAATANDAKSVNGYSAGYAFGSHLAQLQSQGVALEAVFSGILDALSGRAPRVDHETMRTTLDALEQGHPAAAQKDKLRPAVRARSGAYIDDFAALNAKREGVVSLPSGVQYEVLQAGSGRQPGEADTVRVSYRASLTNGAVFDSTDEDKEPARLKISDIAVPGLREALLLMNEGAKWRVVIPPSMGFRASGNNMLRRRDLIYEIELVAIEPPADTAHASDKSEGTGTTPPTGSAANPP